MFYGAGFYYGHEVMVGPELSDCVSDRGVTIDRAV